MTPKRTPTKDPLHKRMAEALRDARKFVACFPVQHDAQTKGELAAATKQRDDTLSLMDEVLREFDSGASGQGWQPISTAPKGRIICYWPDGSIETVDWDAAYYGAVDDMASHWMPLPAAPGDEEGEK